MSELDALDPVPEQVKLTTGTVIQLENLRARQFFKLLRIITHGSMPNMRDFSIFRFDPDTSAEEFGGRLLAIMAMSIPDAEDQTIDFIRSMCKPVGLIERRNLNKADTERNSTLWEQFDRDLYNPELDDLVTIIEAIVRRESADIQALGKRLGQMFKLAEKTGQVPTSPNQTSPEQTSSADSPAPTTSSPTSTTGTTTASETSPSDDSARSSQPSANDASTAVGSVSSG